MEIAANSNAPGPMPQFRQHHLLLALLTIRDRGAIGRKALSKAMKIGEGSIRSILERLTRAGYVRTERKGNMLTVEGEELLEKTGLRIVVINEEGISVGKCDVAVIVPGSGQIITDGFAQRDAAVRAGALGATTLIHREGGLFFPDGERMRDQKKLRGQLTEGSVTGGLNEGDTVIIGTADDDNTALSGALAAAMDIL